MGYPRQGGRPASVPAARGTLEASTGLRRRRFARLSGPAKRWSAEAQAHVAAGYKAVKLRIGDTPARDLARVAAVRKALGGTIEILTDANTGYTVADARKAMPGLEEHGVGWLEEPFPPHDYAATRRRRPSATCRSRQAKITTLDSNSIA